LLAARQQHEAGTRRQRDAADDSSLRFSYLRGPAAASFVVLFASSPENIRLVLFHTRRISSTLCMVFALSSSAWRLASSPAVFTSPVTMSSSDLSVVSRLLAVDWRGVPLADALLGCGDGVLRGRDGGAWLSGGLAGSGAPAVGLLGCGDGARGRDGTA
jgi:hypothetical protein